MNNSALHYHEIKDAGVVVAKLENTDLDACRIFSKIMYGADLKYLFIDWRGNDMVMMDKKYIGRSKCNTDCDDYDYDTGANLARVRCLNKYHNALARKLLGFLEELRAACATFEYYLERRGISYDNVETVEDIKKSRFYNNL